MGAWLFLLAILALGFACARAVWPAPRRWSPADPLRLAAAAPLGFGIGSCLFFAFRVVFQLPAGIAIVAVFAALAALGYSAWQQALTAPSDAPAVGGRAPAWLWLLLAATLTMAFLTCLMLQSTAPHGEVDAWSIWNLRARFLFRASEFVGPFSATIDWTHPDYPLLLPGALALVWHAGGNESPAIAGAIAVLFLFSAVAVPFFLIRLLRGPALAVLCAIGVCGATNLIRVTASQYADIYCAAFIVLSTSLLAYACETESAGAGPYTLAGLSAGFAAWTKNEGLLFCVVLLVAYLLCVTSHAERRRRVQWLVPFLAGMLAVLAVVGHFKFRLAPPNDLINVSKTSVFGAKTSDFSHFFTTFFAFLAELLTLGGVLVPPVIVYSLWLALVRFRANLTGAALLPLFAAALQLAGCFAVYACFAKELEPELNVSLPRVLLQLWPTALTGIFLISRDIFEKAPQPSGPRSRSK